MLASLFLSSLRAVQSVTAPLPIPRLGASRRWAGWRSASFCVPIILVVGVALAQPGQGLGLLGRRLRRRPDRDHGADWLPVGWAGVELLAVPVPAPR